MTCLQMPLGTDLGTQLLVRAGRRKWLERAKLSEATIVRRQIF
jgi:hypothetical protein